MSMICSYKDCSNVQRSFCSKTFFNIPNDSRREQWIKNSGNESLIGMSPKIRRVICEDHFEPKYLRRQFNCTILWKEALPIPYSSETSEPQNEVEYFEMNESEDDAEQNQLETNDDNNFTIVLNDPLNTRKRLHKPNQQSDKNAKEIEITTTSTKVILNKELKLKQNSLALDDENVEVDFILVQEEQQQDEINEKTPKPSKKLRPDNQQIATEQDPNRPNESSPKLSNEVIIIPSKSQIKPDLLRSKIATDGIVSSTEAFDANNEETYFALSLLGTMRRLTPHKRAIAKCHILSYLTELEYGSS